jgi:hypothetical protein
MWAEDAVKLIETVSCLQPIFRVFQLVQHSPSVVEA